MADIVKKEFSIDGSRSKPITLDVTYPKVKTALPVIVFCHGFKGFKDWGHFNYTASKFAEAGIATVKFNFSFNGITGDRLSEITDFESFGANNYSTELADLDLVIQWVSEGPLRNLFEKEQLCLLGHSRGGGICLLKAAYDKRVMKTVTWATVSEFESFFRPETIKEWSETGVVFAINKRTGQQLPLYRQFYDDFKRHHSKLDIRKAIHLIETPLLLIHGEQDESVPLSHSEAIYNAVKHAILIKVEHGNHTFGTQHPFDEDTKNEMLEELIENTIEFVLD